MTGGPTELRRHTLQDWGDLFGHVAPQEPVNPPPPLARKAPPKLQKSQTAGSQLDTGSPSRPTPNPREDCARWFREADTDGDGRSVHHHACQYLPFPALPANIPIPVISLYSEKYRVSCKDTCSSVVSVPS